MKSKNKIELLDELLQLYLDGKDYGPIAIKYSDKISEFEDWDENIVHCKDIGFDYIDNIDNIINIDYEAYIKKNDALNEDRMMDIFVNHLSIDDDDPAVHFLEYKGYIFSVVGVLQGNYFVLSDLKIYPSMDALNKHYKDKNWVLFKDENTYFNFTKDEIVGLWKKLYIKDKVKLTAFWGNDDAESTIIIPSNTWDDINKGGSYSLNADSYYEGNKSEVVWVFENKIFSIYGEDGLQCVYEMPIKDLIIIRTR